MSELSPLGQLKKEYEQTLAENLKYQMEIVSVKTKDVYDTFQKHQDDSTQELRSYLSRQIQCEVFFDSLVHKAQTAINSTSLLEALQALLQCDNSAA